VLAADSAVFTPPAKRLAPPAEPAGTDRPARCAPALASVKTKEATRPRRAMPLAASLARRASHFVCPDERTTFSRAGRQLHGRQQSVQVSAGASSVMIVKRVELRAVDSIRVGPTAEVSIGVQARRVTT
jgi:hypothetical protein